MQSLKPDHKWFPLYSHNLILQSCCSTLQFCICIGNIVYILHRRHGFYFELMLQIIMYEIFQSITITVPVVLTVLVLLVIVIVIVAAAAVKEVCTLLILATHLYEGYSRWSWSYNFLESLRFVQIAIITADSKMTEVCQYQYQYGY